MANFVFEDPARVGDLGSARLNKYSIPSFSAELTHEPCDRHAYSAYWTRDLEQKPVNFALQRFAEFLRRYDIPMFRGDSSFVVLTHQYVLQGGKVGPKGPSTTNEQMPLCLHMMETLVSPPFLTKLESWLESTQPKLLHLSQEFGDSNTLYRIGAFDSHSPLVELDVSVQMYDEQQLSKFKLVDPRGITLTYKFRPNVLETLAPPCPITGGSDLEKEKQKIDAIKNYTYIRSA